MYLAVLGKSTRRFSKLGLLLTCCSGFVPVLGCSGQLLPYTNATSVLCSKSTIAKPTASETCRQYQQRVADLERRKRDRESGEQLAEQGRAGPGIAFFAIHACEPLVADDVSFSAESAATCASFVEGSCERARSQGFLWAFETAKASNELGLWIALQNCAARFFGPEKTIPTVRRVASKWHSSGRFVAIGACLRKCKLTEQVKPDLRELVASSAKNFYQSAAKVVTFTPESDQELASDGTTVIRLASSMRQELGEALSSKMIESAKDSQARYRERVRQSFVDFHLNRTQALQAEVSQAATVEPLVSAKSRVEEIRGSVETWNGDESVSALLASLDELDGAIDKKVERIQNELVRAEEQRKRQAAIEAQARHETFCREVGRRVDSSAIVDAVAQSLRSAANRDLTFSAMLAGGGPPPGFEVLQRLERASRKEVIALAAAYRRILGSASEDLKPVMFQNSIRNDLRLALTPSEAAFLLACVE